MSMGIPNFFHYPFDVQIILGLTLIGVPNEWNEVDLVGYIKSYCYAFGREEVGIISAWLDKASDGNRKAHIACSCLYSKQKLLKIRMVPVILGNSQDDVMSPSSDLQREFVAITSDLQIEVAMVPSDLKETRHIKMPLQGGQSRECSMITIRPYCFWVKLNPHDEPIPYMFPKYGSSDVHCEKVEATLLLQENNVQPTIAACLMEHGILPSDGRPWDAASAYPLWLKAKNTPVGPVLERKLCKLHDSIRKFLPYEYDVTDDVVYASDWRNIFLHNSWLWERTRDYGATGSSIMAQGNFATSGTHRMEYGVETPSPLSPPFVEQGRQMSVGEAMWPIPAKAEEKPRERRNDRRAGCIRYESNRSRWVVDLSIDGRRMQKCFHEGFYGLVGGMQEARKWRYEYLKQTRGYFVEKLELRIMEDLFDKIMQMDESVRQPLIEALKTPIPGFEDVYDVEKVNSIFDFKMANNLRKMCSRRS